MLCRIILHIFLLFFATGAFAQPAGLSTEAVNNLETQLVMVHGRKAEFTAIQKKINSNIVLYLHEVIRKEGKLPLPKLQHQVELNAAGQVLVDIRGNVTDSVLAAIKENGGHIVNAFPQYRAIRAWIPIVHMEKAAEHPDIDFIDQAAKAGTNKLTTSEGDAAHNAPLLRSKNFRGQGIKVGVLSDSVDYLANVQATGDLPSVTVLPGQSGVPASGEGTAMLEIVYDLAPSASLYFATAFGSPASFAANIIALKNAGCKVIVDDVFYYNESPFQDDVISQAVITVTNAGMAYFSSAGNDRNKHSNTSGTWEGNYVRKGSGSWINSHVFDPGTPGGNLNYIYSNGRALDLFWSDPLGQSNNDYDLYIVDSGGNIIRYSIDSQTGTQNPYEQIWLGTTSYAGYYALVENYNNTAATRFLHLTIYRGHLNYNTTGATKGHATVDQAFCVAATDAGGRTTPFVGTEPIETFSSDGPRRVFYNPDGTPITPGNLLATGGRLRMKPDITAADGVKCSTPGFSDFHGTSAAAPHAAAVAALLYSANPKLSLNRLRLALTRSALPSPATWNEYRGWGIVMANRALGALSPLGGPVLMPLLLSSP